MTQFESFDFVIRVLERLRIPYMIVGSIASIAYGKPRLTQDMDIVIDIRKEQVPSFVASFDQHWGVDKEMIQRAIMGKFRFNVINIPSGNKIDFFVLGDTAYDQEQFARRRREKFNNKRYAFFASVEDVIIKKLDYYLEGKSEKHLEDIKGILRTHQGNIDFDYIGKWTRERESFRIWEELK